LAVAAGFDALKETAPGSRQGPSLCLEAREEEEEGASGSSATFFLRGR